MSYFSSYCAEVQDYLKACEHLLESAHIRNRQFSEEELQMVQSYAMDVSNAFVDAKNHIISQPPLPEAAKA